MGHSWDPRFGMAVEIESHIIEATTGRPTNTSEPRPEYDLEKTNQAERDRHKIKELESQGVQLSLRTWERMRTAYRERGLDGLVDQRARKPTGNVQIDQRIIEVLVSSLHARANDSTRSKQWVIDDVKRRLGDLFGEEAPSLPSRATMYRLIATASEGLAVFEEAATRRSVASRPKGMLRPTQGYRPGERVEIDSTKADMLIITPDGREVRADLTIAVDTATRSICAAVLNLSTNSTDLSLLLAEMVAPPRTHPNWEQDLAVRHRLLPEGLRYSSLTERLDHHREHPIIIPESIVADLGPPYRSQHFRRACELLGISLEPTRPGTPTDKPTVERTIQTVNRQFCQYLPGYTGRNTAHRGRGIQAVLTLEQAQDLLDEWVAVKWQKRPHQGLTTIWGGRHLSPNAMYSHYVAHMGVLRLPLEFEDYIELLPLKWVAIQRYGINHDLRIYDSKALNDLRHCRNPDPTSGGKWKLHYNSNHPFHVWLQGPKGWIQVEWIHRHLFAKPFGARLWAQAKKQTPDRTHETIARTALQLQQELFERSGPTQGKVFDPDPDPDPEDDTGRISEVQSNGKVQMAISMANFDPDRWPE